MDLFCRIVGQGMPLVLVHGLFGSSDNLMTVAKKLGEYFTVYLPDQRNHGQSPHADEHHYQAMADDLHAFLLKHRIHQPVMVGHSMGGKAVMQFAVKYPDVYRKMVVVDICQRAYQPQHDQILKGLHAVDLKNLKSRKDAELALEAYESNADVRQFLLKNLYRNEAGEFAWRINLPVLTAQIAEVGVPVEIPTPIQKSVLFLRGEKSRYILDEDTEAILRDFPKAEIKTIKEAGHWIHAEQPQRFIQAILDFA